MIDTKAHYRRLVTKLGGIDPVTMATGRKRQTIAAYFNVNNAQQPTAELMLELQSLTGDYAYHHACGIALGLDAEISLLAQRERLASEVLKGNYDDFLSDKTTTEEEEAA